ncbi:YciI family protein [Parachitinimonas caeni]|uniref:YciI family protein n=1 Tax=Parachitinimonas caeni TaxID=3031301 RepID=A0ABT7E2J3_9NEIS|nr:YciI family protein [Parachitinimonas caeni]MDK2126530.1 YciI family protein [Parachitinimonas caeni]
MFLVDLEFIRPLDEVDQHVAAHRDYLKDFYENGSLFMGGRKIPRSGGIILSRHTTRQEVESVFNADPLVLARVAKYSVTEFQPVMMTEALKELI